MIEGLLSIQVLPQVFLIHVEDLLTDLVFDEIDIDVFGGLNFIMFDGFLHARKNISISVLSNTLEQI